MNRRPALIALALVAMMTPAADAAPRGKQKPQLCKIVVDPANDPVGPANVKNDSFNSGSLDILSADIASDTRGYTMVIRVRELVNPDDTAPLGQRWTFNFSVGTERFSYMTSTSRLFTNTPQIGSGAQIDHDKNEVRMHATFAEFKRRGVPTKDGTVIKNIEISTGQYLTTPQDAGFGDGSFLYTADSATTTKVYPLRANSCVRVGQ